MIHPPMRGAALTCLAVAGVASCQSEDASSVTMKIPGLLKLEIMPADATFPVSPSMPAKVDFKAMGTFTDGKMADQAHKVDWHVDIISLGSFGADSVNSRFESSVIRGGKAIVQALAEPRMAETSLTLVYTAGLLRPGAPSESEDLFKGAGEDAAKAPTITAPADGVTMPRATPGEFSWTPATGTNLFELSFSNEVTNLRIYTTGSSVVPTPEEWSILTATNAGSAVTVKVRGMTSGGAAGAGAAKPITVVFGP